MYKIIDIINCIFKNIGMLDVNRLSKEIRNARLTKNLSMESVAKEADITRATLSKIENGDPSCTFESYLKVMSILGIELSFSSVSKNKNRKRATRKILKNDRKINHWVVFTIEVYSNHINKPTNEIFKMLEQKGLIDLLYSDYEDLHGMSPEYINDFIDGCFKGEKR